MSLWIFKLEHRSNCRKCSWLCCWNIQLPVSLLVKNFVGPQNGGHFENVKIFNTASIWHHMERSYANYLWKSIFHRRGATNDVTTWRQSQPSTFIFTWNWHIYHDNSKTIWDMITKLYMQMYLGYVTMLVNNNKNDFIDDVAMFKNMSEFWTTVT